MGESGFQSDVCLSPTQSVEGIREDIFPRIGRTDLEQDAAYADTHDGSDLEQFAADRVHLRLSPIGAFQGQPPERLNQRVGQRGEVQPELIALHLVGRQPVGEQAHLLLDAVLHFASCAVELLV